MARIQPDPPQELLPFVEQSVVYCRTNGQREQGVVTAAAGRAKLPALFVRYGTDAGAKLTYVHSLETLNGESVEDIMWCNKLLMGDE